MIECKRHGIKLLRPDTCIARQKVLAEGDKIIKSGRILRGGIFFKYNQYKDYCYHCDTGLELFRKHLSGELDPMPDMKTCMTCKNTLPADTEHFDFASRSADKLTNDCKVCRLAKSPFGPVGALKHAADDNADHVKKTERVSPKPCEDQPAEIIKFDPDEARHIAKNVTDETMAFLEPFIDSTDLMDQIRAVAERVGVECQRMAISGAE